MKVRVKHAGFKQGAAKFKKASRSFETVAKAALGSFGEQATAWFKGQILSGAYGYGETPLVETSTYVNSLEPEFTEALAVEIKPTGDNRNMSNEALGELLEYGDSKTRAQPHWRFLAVWIEANSSTVGKEIADELLRRS